jgi:pimeloyl-ACP methyl ester carboxylesterase
MKNCLNQILCIAVLIAIMPSVQAQSIQINASFYSQSLDTVKKVNIYLPQDYYVYDTAQYPVIYFLHGAGGNHNSYSQVPTGLYSMVNTGEINPYILVKPDGSCGPYLGSYYINSVLYGNYEDFIIDDIISFVEENFRVNSGKYARFISGHSMGGGGAVRLAIEHPELFRASVSFSNDLVGDLILDTWKSLLSEENDGSCIPDYNAGVHSQLYMTSCGAKCPNLSNDPPIDFLLDSACNIVDSVHAKTALYDPGFIVHKLTPEDRLAFFISCGTNDEYGFFDAAFSFTDSLTKYSLDHAWYPFEGTHSFNVMAYMESLRFIDSLYVEGLQHASIGEAQMILSQLSVVPNPCSDKVTISFHLKSNSPIQVRVFDMQGRTVFEKNDAIYSRGINQLQFDMSGSPQGVYTLRMRTNREVITRKIVKR